MREVVERREMLRKKMGSGKMVEGYVIKDIGL